jgi:energy-coupling factor transporter transmembrane protein EcfT
MHISNCIVYARIAVLTLLVFLKVILLRGGVIILNSLSSYGVPKAYVTPGPTPKLISSPITTPRDKPL